jgi:hypothetical protein
VDTDDDDDGPAQVQPLTVGQLKTMIEVHYNVQRLVKDKRASKAKGEDVFVAKPALTPWESIHHVYNAARKRDDTPKVRELRAVTHTPVLRPNGSVLWEPGYDSAIKYLYLPDRGLAVPPIPDKPTATDIKQAVELFLVLTDEYPFVSADHRANFNGLAFTPLMRPLVRPPYRFGFITATNAGSGKGFLAGTLGGLHGRVMRGEMPRESEELRKQITSVLMTTTAPVVQFDNLTGVVRSPVLEGLLTSAEWTDRWLGQSRDVHARNDRLWVATGNNAILGGDMARRTLVVEIDPKMPDPYTRTGFKIHPPNYVRLHRGELLAAMLTIARGWVQAKMPTEITRSDDYAVWQGAMCGLLKWAEMPGTFGTEKNTIAVVDSDNDEWGQFLGGLHEAFGNRKFTVAEVYDMLEPGSAREVAKKRAVEGLKGKAATEAIHAAIKATDPEASMIDPAKLPGDLADKFSRINTRTRTGSSAAFKVSLGRWFQNRAGRYALGYKVEQERVGDGHHPGEWRVWHHGQIKP